MSEKNPVYLLAGGRSRNPQTPDPLIQAVLRRSGRTSPSIAYIGAANADNVDFFSRMAKAFKEAGAGKVVHAATNPEMADLYKTLSTLELSDIIFISGGDVEVGMKKLTQNKMVYSLKSLYEMGKLFFGISAGSIMLAKEWVRWRDPDDNSTAELFPCLGFAPIICDCHDEQGGWEELKAALELEEDNTMGYGLVTGTALVVSPDGEMEALGDAVHRFVRHGNSLNRISDLLPAIK